MTHNVIDALAGIIRQVDGNNQLSPTDLGKAIVAKMPPFIQNTHGLGMISFVERINPNKTMSAGLLAELIVAEFGLDKVTR